MSRERFLKVYANLPEGVREEVIAVVDNKWYTWNAAFVEVKDKTLLGENIIKKLVQMELI